MIKIKEVLLFVIVLVLLVGVATANEVSTEADTPTSDTPLILEKAVQEKSTVSPSDTSTVEKIKQKTNTNQTKTTKNIQKNTNNLKKDTTVNSWTTLNSTITDATEDTTITLTGETYRANGTITFNKAITITIDGNGQTIDGNQTQVFYIYSGSSVILKNITIINAKNTDGYGGAIDNGGNLTIINSTLKNNTAKYGGAINNNNGNITIIDSNLTQNTATGQNGLGGAIYNNEGGNLNITQSNLTQNTANGQKYGYGYGGAIYNAYGSTLSITNSNLTQNTANGQNYGYGYGGAIYNNGGNLNITDSNLTQNTATGQYGRGGAIYNNEGGNLNITQSNLTQNTATSQGQDGWGGAIYNNGGNLNITDSNLTQNTVTGQSGFGGAIYNTGSGTLNITDSNLTENTATGQQYSGYGGAIYNGYGSTLNITDSNLTQNTATGQYGRGGAIYDASMIILTSITSSNFINNTAPLGAAIYADGNVSFTSNTFKENTATNNKETIDLNGYWNGIHKGNNYESTDIALKEIKLNIKDNQNTFQQGEEVVLNYSIQLTTLMNYWDFETGINDITLYINNEKNKTTKYENTTLTDLTPGTYEIYYTTCNRQSNKVTFTVYYPDTECNVTNYTLLVQAIENATNNPYTSYKINLQAGDYNATQSIDWKNSATRKITINGNEQTLDGQNTYQFIKIAQEHNLTLTNITITNYTAEGGGAIENRGNLTIINSTLTQNKATGQNYVFGGAIYNTYGTLSITDSNLTHNKATGQTNGYGGAIYNGHDSTLTITQSNLTQNTATGQYGWGGAIYNGGTLTITQSNLTQNTATVQNYGEGGAIYNEGTLTLTQSNLTQNKATGQQYSGYGGAISNYGTLTITDSDLTQNKATGQYDGFGGAINNYGNLNITDSNLIQNKATGQYDGFGGAIYNRGTLNIKNSILEYNNATHGGAIYNYNSNITINNTNLTYNNANEYGGAINNNGTRSNLTIINSNLNNNTATGQNGEGGAIYNIYSNLNINNSILEYNNATQGGAIYNNEGEAVIESNYFIANPSEMTGKAIINKGTATIENNEGHETSTYNGTIYTNSTKTVTIEHNKFYDKLNTTINISTDNPNPAIGDVINITFTLKDQLGRPIIDENITITIKDYTTNKTTDVTGTTSMEHTIKSNETLINATYPGNNNYNTNTTTLLVTAPKLETKLIVDDVDTKVGQNFTITGTLLDNYNKPVPIETVNITVNGSTNTATTNNLGQFNTTFTLDQMGEYPITVIYPGTDVYHQSTNSTAKVTATKTDTKLTLNVSNTTVVNSTVVTITANLTDIDNNPLINQPVTITIGDERFTLNTDENGIISKEYTTHEVGKQSINVTYNGNNMYNANSTTTEINVYKIDTKLTLTVSNNTPVNSTNITITVTLTDTTGNKLANQNITLNVAGKIFNLKTNSNGIATQTYTPTTLGKQTITATYKGDSQHNNSTATTNITVKKINAKIDLKVSNNTPVNNTPINITVTLTDNTGNKLANQNITIKVSDKTFNVKTNSNGIATQTYTPTTLGKQTITATYKGDSQHNNSTATTNITVKKINTKIDLKVSNNTPINNTPINITVTLTDADNNKLANQQVTLNINGKTVTAKTNTNGIVTQTYTPTQVETQNITATYLGDSRYNNSTKTIQITVKNKIKTKTTVNLATGVIGEKLTIKATVTDTNGNNVNEGNLIFKVNGVTIKDNGKLTGSSNPLKVKVVNGVATATIIPDINMTNAKNITAYYVGTTIYNASTSNPASINISKRNATIEVTTNKKIIKQGQVLTITAKIYDTTNGKKTSNITRYQDEYVYFKVNGITLKDANGEMLKVKIINGTATVNYTIPLGISCVTDMQTLTPKNHTIQVGLYNKNYQNIMTKTPTFQVERSNITINLANATINNKTHTLSMKITIKDYLKNTVAGPNKLVIKVNGITLKNGTNVQYYYTTDGVLNLKNIPIPTAKNYTRIEVITQDRLAYKSQRNTTKVIKIIN